MRSSLRCVSFLLNRKGHASSGCSFWHCYITDWYNNTIINLSMLCYAIYIYIYIYIYISTASQLILEILSFDLPGRKRRISPQSLASPQSLFESLSAQPGRLRRDWRVFTGSLKATLKSRVERLSICARDS